MSRIFPSRRGGVLITRIVGWLVSAIAILALMIAGIGPAVADEGEFAPPENILNTSLEPRCMNITWQHAPEDVLNYTVQRFSPFDEFVTIPPAQQSHHSCGIEPNSDFHVKVCAVSAAETQCEEADFHTPPPQPEAQAQHKPTPPIVATNSGKDWVDFSWGWPGTNAGFSYKKYFLWLSPTNGDPLRTVEHKSSGNWGYWKFEGLKPDTLYRVQVQGCTSGILDPKGTCWGKSEWRDVRTKPDLAYGPDTCKSGFVWRDGVSGDHICVTPERRQKVADDLATGRLRMQQRNPALTDRKGSFCEPTLTVAEQSCGGWQPPKCLDPYVPRDIPRENVLVCVDQKEADLIKQENANPRTNMVQP